MTVDIKLDVDFFEKIKADVLDESLPIITSDIEASQYTPYRTGATQESMINDSKVESSKIVLRNTTDYADKIYNSARAFRKTINANATSRWYENYLKTGGAENITDIVNDVIKNKLS